MAVPPLLEQKYSKEIIEILLKKHMTIPELNESNETKNLSISTATLYRRMKELTLAGFLEKLEDGTYTVSTFGEKTYNELFSAKNSSNDLQKDISGLLSELSHKQSYVLHKIQQKPAYTSGLLQEISISPNELTEIFKILMHYNLIEIIERPGKKPGRPKKMYQISEKGKLFIQTVEELHLKLREMR